MEFAEEEYSEPEQGGTNDVETRQIDKLNKSSKSSRLQKRAATDKRCTSCGTTTTPVWRWGGEAKETLLCNACSLRIRRSTGRPNRAKSPGERAVKRTQSLTSSDSGEAHPSRGPLQQEHLAIEDEGFRARLNDIVSKERNRLLGVSSAVSMDELWPEMQWPGGEITAPSTPHPTEWEPFPSVPQYSYDGLSETGRLDFGSPVNSNFQSLEPGMVGEMF